MDDAVADGVGQDGIANLVLPAADAELGAEDGGGDLVPGLNDLQQVAGLRFLQAVEQPLVQNQQVGTLVLLDKSDWKLFQTLLPQWQEAYTARLCDEYAAILTGPYRGSDAKRLIRKDKKRLAAMSDLLREQAITEEDLAVFSDGLRERVREICSIEARQKDSPC